MARAWHAAGFTCHYAAGLSRSLGPGPGRRSSRSRARADELCAARGLSFAVGRQTRSHP